MSGFSGSGDSTGAALTLAWYAVVLLVVFTVAFWAGRAVGPDVDPVPPPPVAPHAPTEAH